jgi:pyridoxal phosphate enzyme (YggS family)
LKWNKLTTVGQTFLSAEIRAAIHAVVTFMTPRLLENLTSVRQRIADAAKRSGRSAEAVMLVAVTKYVTTEVVAELVQAGCHDLGEARPQELWKKAAGLARVMDDQNTNPPIYWHLIGHLQRNKVEATLPLVSLIHSGDSMRLLQAIDAAAETQQRRAAVLLEINVSGDETKHGFAPRELAPLLPAVAALRNLEVRALMCMAAREGDDVVARRNFAMLRELRDRLLPEQHENVSLDELSMGMSSDFEIAIEEGATIVRIGSALFEGIGP